MHLKTTSVRRQNMKIGFRVLTCIQRGILWVDIVMGETDLLNALRSEGVLNRGEEESRLVFGTGAGVLVSRSACDGSAWQPLSRLVGLVHGVSRARSGDCLKLAHSEAVVVDAHTSLHDSGRSQLGGRLCVSFVLLRSNLRTKFSMEIFNPGMQGTNLKQIVHGCVFVLVLLPLQAFGKYVFFNGVSQSAAVNLLSDERRSVSVFFVELLDQAPLLVGIGH
jgi:hypothetical protein